MFSMGEWNIKFSKVRSFQKWGSKKRVERGKIFIGLAIFFHFYENMELMVFLLELLLFH